MILFGNQQNRAQYKPETVTIGTQTWCLRNFSESTLIDGTVIPEIQNATTWAGLTTAAWCNYNNDPAIGAVYGKLYNWWACALIDAAYTPFGWRTQTSAEWTTLINYLGGASVAGGKLKEAGLVHWNTPNTGADNSSGFTGLPGGRNIGSSFTGINQYCYMLCSDQYNSTNINSARLNYINAFCDMQINGLKYYGYSIRLIKI
jgi:uncharacterized protein (TIGR02145 family)